MPRIGLLSVFAENDPQAQAWLKELMQGLQELSWVNGRNVQIEVSLRTLALPESANGQRATMQTSQRLDATHGGEVFPVAGNESRFDTYFR